MDDLTKAIRLAARQHDGQLDKAGEPYILHPLRVMLTQTEPAARITAALHDVVEDTEVTLEDLSQDFSDEIVAAVDALSRREDETYDDYLDRAFQDRIARLVKRADLNDNLSRAYQNGAVGSDKIQQYEAALKKLDEYETKQQQPST